MEKPIMSVQEVMARIAADKAAGIQRPTRAIRKVKLETLSAEVRDDLLSYAETATVDGAWKKLKSWGYSVSRATVGRFLQKERHAAALRGRKRCGRNCLIAL
jgi:hypothetical protein